MKSKVEALLSEVIDGEKVVEVTLDGHIICTISGAEGRRVQIVSPHRLSFEATKNGLTDVYFAA